MMLVPLKDLLFVLVVSFGMEIPPSVSRPLMDGIFDAKTNLVINIDIAKIMTTIMNDR